MNTTKVEFLINDGDLFAFFPELEYHERETPIKTCYAHLGQHSGCHVDYAKESVKAHPSQYEPLKKELESIGYNLQIVNA